ncbi:MAG: dihydroorotate dehydrogenase (quinone), partial [Bacteroidetes bacterium]|nr:dihydroorotate dehydrogenase (quinone) [Bacteroidota bacterium]
MFNLVRSFLFLLPAEKAHYFTMNTLSILMAIPSVASIFKSRNKKKPYHQPKTVSGLTFKNPVGIGAGFD